MLLLGAVSLCLECALLVKSCVVRAWTRILTVRVEQRGHFLDTVVFVPLVVLLGKALNEVVQDECVAREGFTVENKLY